MPAKDVSQLCKRCNVLEAALIVRSEPLCRDCFSKYVHTKVVKRMEGFRTRHAGAGQERKLLLPMSSGVSSVTLLHILDKHLQSQRQKTGRTGFSLHIVHIASPSIADLGNRFTALQETYPNHTYSTVSLSSLFPDSSTLTMMLSQLPSATSVVDITNILLTRLGVEFALSNRCEGILWSHSTTALAETILASTAKGRGFALPWQVLDGPSPYEGNIPFYYPMRDVLKKELMSHARIVEPSLLDFMDPTVLEKTTAPPSKKDTTIDVLMKQYFEDVEEGYPSIVSNVVRTAGKLVVPDLNGGKGVVRCRLCCLPVGDGRMGVEGWGGDQEETREYEGGMKEKELCYGCLRSLPKDLVQLLP